MKTIILTIFLLMPVMFVTACGREATTGSSVVAIEYPDDFEGPRSHYQGLRMYVPAGSVTPTELRLSMINDNDLLHFQHGVMFSIQQYVSGAWEQVPFTNSPIWIMPLYSVFPNTTFDDNILWDHIHEPLAPGQYRVLRSFRRSMRQHDTPEVTLYAPFTVTEDWETAYLLWQETQKALAAVALSRFEGLDMDILAYSSRGLTLTVTNNNPTYTYIINSLFVGWEDRDRGMASVEYSIFRLGFDNPSWPFEDEKTLAPGAYFSLVVDWHDTTGHILSRRSGARSNPYAFDVVLHISLDVDMAYIQENFRHIIPGVPVLGHNIRAPFDISSPIEP